MVKSEINTTLDFQILFKIYFVVAVLLRQGLHHTFLTVLELTHVDQAGPKCIEIFLPLSLKCWGLKGCAIMPGYTLLLKVPLEYSNFYRNYSNK